MNDAEMRRMAEIIAEPINARLERVEDKIDKVEDKLDHYCERQGDHSTRIAVVINDVAEIKRKQDEARKKVEKLECQKVSILGEALKMTLGILIGILGFYFANQYLFHAAPRP